MKLTLEEGSRTVTIDDPKQEEQVCQVFDEMMIPAMLGLGYQLGSIQDYILEKAGEIETEGKA